MQVMVENPRDQSCWGFGFTSEGQCPTKPKHEGTIQEIRDALAVDEEMRALWMRGVFYRCAWFWRGKRIEACFCNGQWQRFCVLVDSWAWNAIETMKEIRLEVADENGPS